MRTEPEIRGLLREITAMRKTCQITIRSPDMSQHPLSCLMGIAQAQTDVDVTSAMEIILLWVVGEEQDIPRHPDVDRLEENVAKWESVNGKLES